MPAQVGWKPTSALATDIGATTAATTSATTRRRPSFLVIDHSLLPTSVAGPAAGPASSALLLRQYGTRWLIVSNAGLPFLPTATLARRGRGQVIIPVPPRGTDHRPGARSPQQMVRPTRAVAALPEHP